ncbi:LysR substrate-binding domain-containing protein [Rhizobium rosettiformans]|uniref:LysR substrate-binding domain-containing protein n=1 Tax=Rhizobium rosettiformans TaxID=1368430 RepID=UPI0028551EF9|nr:LysR substrate-binding domain-containing protein [Rhizobium rosettiformans]MDR7030295.1 LysR family glycine cleavage system transcriptional activator [Rhizobium rosettiformans]MDR7065724.1 LysR family glycine cleavage system transcriptional activator [Rhizobium rosettiformans]
MRRLPALSAMKVFEVVGQTRSFTRAAEQLNLTQSAVSRQVRNLEEQLGETLVIRRHHHLELTPSGAELLASLQQAFHTVEMTVRNIREKSNLRRLRINVPPTFAKRWLLPRLTSLRAFLSDVDLSITTDLEDNLSDRGMIDCAIRFGDGEWPSLRSERLFAERHIAVCAPHLLADFQDGDLIDLSRFTFLHVLASADQRYLTWQRWLDAAGLAETDTQGGLEFDLLDLVIEAACNGLGVAVADRSMVAPLMQTGALTQVLDVEVEGHESYWLVTRTDGAQSPHVGAFRRWLSHEIGGSAVALPRQASA